MRKYQRSNAPITAPTRFATRTVSTDTTADATPRIIKNAGTTEAKKISPFPYSERTAGMLTAATISEKP